MKRYDPGSRGAISNSLIGIRSSIADGTLPFTTHECKDGERLDHLAHRHYGDGQMWWVIAAASGVGWWLQVPPGTQLIIPMINTGA